MKKHRGFYSWMLVLFLAIALTALALIYQSNKGPTKPLRTELQLNDGQMYYIKLPRSHGGSTDCLVEINVPDKEISAELIYRRYPTNDEWRKIPMVRAGDSLSAALPNQPPAGKLEYYIEFSNQGNVLRAPDAGQAVIRFRGDVPAAIILPHASLMFIAMFLSNLTLFLALLGFRQFRLFGWITIITLFIGGLVFGPLVQNHAFGEYWTGFPNGMDLTDNKTLIAFVFWLIAVIANLKKERKYVTVLASVVMVVIFSIPHSVRGSELNPETGKIETGMVTHPSGRFND